MTFSLDDLRKWERERKCEETCGIAGTVDVALTAPTDASKLGDCALWTATATMGHRWSGVGRSYHAATAIVIALQALTDALRADFPRAHGWAAPAMKTEPEPIVPLCDPEQDESW